MRVAAATTAASVSGHRYLYVASEGFGDPVTCFTVVDVADPAQPQVPHVFRFRSAARIPVPNRGAGILFYDVTDPASPRLLSFFDTPGGASRGTHHVWFAAGGRELWAAGGAGSRTSPPIRPIPMLGKRSCPNAPRTRANSRVGTIPAFPPAIRFPCRMEFRARIRACAYTTSMFFRSVRIARISG